MRFRNVLYSDAVEKLDSSGIAAKIEKAVSNYDVGIQGFVSGDDIVSMVREIKDTYTFIPAEERAAFQDGLQNVFRNPGDYSWKTNRLEGSVETEEVEMEDFPGLIGWWSAQILPPKDVFAYQKFGFRNITDFTGSVAAMINERLRQDGPRKGYQWRHTDGKGRIFENEIGGDGNCDLRIYQNDVTPYETFDPLGNQVSFRPQMKTDRSGASPYHSTEDSFLAGVLHWIDQTDIIAETLEDKARGTIQWARSLGQGGDTCAEHFFGRADSFRRIGAYMAGAKLPVLDANNRSERSSPIGLATAGESAYGMYIGNGGELIIAGESIEKGISPEKKASATFSPLEADHLVKGILFQAAKGLGRTSAAQLISMLEYRFSPEWDEDLKSVRGRA